VDLAAQASCTVPVDPQKALKIFPMSSGHFENNHLFCHHFGVEPLTPRDSIQSDDLRTAILNEMSQLLFYNDNKSKKAKRLLHTRCILFMHSGT
jgi:hypothetical protein